MCFVISWLCLVPAADVAPPPAGATALKAREVRRPHRPIPKEPKDTPTWTDAESAAKEFSGFPFMGEYERAGTAIQVSPFRDQFYLSVYEGGLPGDGWDGSAIRHERLGKDAIAERLAGYKKRNRGVTPAAAPADALVLFDGSNMDHWANGKMKEGLLLAGARSKRKFTDFRLHFEFQLPLKPELDISHPGRGNSGVFALGAYEVQVADTFGLDLDEEAWQSEGLLKHPDTACGSIYGLRAADTNMCLPPLSWQSMDLVFTAARFNDNGNKVSDARLTAHHNGVLIHDDVTVSRGTGGGPRGPRPEVASGPIYVQSHGNPTVYRNIWIVDRSEKKL